MLGPITGIAALLILGHLWWRAAGLYTGPILVQLTASQALLWDTLLLTTFFTSHSVFATLRLKAWLGLSPRAHRQLYLVVNLIMMILTWLLWAPLAEPALWNIQPPWSYLVCAVPLLALAGFGWTGRHFDMKEFFGATDARKPEGLKLAETGPYALCRHPIYFFTLLLLVQPYMPLGRAVIAIGVAAYTAIGSLIEEKRLIHDFGPTYVQYQKSTPWLIPSPSSILRAFRTRS